MKGVADLDAMERAAIAAARGAGDLLRAFWSADGQKKHSSFIEFKSPTDLVTEADKKAEALIMQTLRAACPAVRFLCEESGLSAEPSAGHAVGRWIVDPLDGTTSFAHGHPHFSVSIAFEDASGEVVIGVVYGVTLDEMFVARKGRGATCNGRPLKVSATKELIKALIVTGFPTDRAQMKRRIDTNLPFFEEILMRARDCRRNGSAALDLCYVAAGRHDLYWEPNLKAWDIAAGALMVQEAGGLFTDMHGAPLTCKSAQSENDKFSVFGSNGHLHSIVLHHFEEVRKRENK